MDQNKIKMIRYGVECVCGCAGRKLMYNEICEVSDCKYVAVVAVVAVFTGGV